MSAPLAALTLTTPSRPAYSRRTDTALPFGGPTRIRPTPDLAVLCGRPRPIVVPVFLVFVLPPIAIARGIEAVGEHRAIYEMLGGIGLGSPVFSWTIRLSTDRPALAAELLPCGILVLTSGTLHAGSLPASRTRGRSDRWRELSLRNWGNQGRQGLYQRPSCPYCVATACHALVVTAWRGLSRIPRVDYLRSMWL